MHTEIRYQSAGIQDIEHYPGQTVSLDLITCRDVHDSDAGVIED